MNNLGIRTITGLGFGVIVLGCTLFNPYLYAALFMFMIAALMREFFSITLNGRFKCESVLSIVSGLALFALIFANRQFGMPALFIALAFVPVLATMVSLLFSKDKPDAALFSHLFCAYVYVAVPLSLTNLAAISQGTFHGKLIASFFMIIWCSDIGAYALGMAFGQKEGSRKLCPGISPKKSWAGYWGGLIFGMAAAAILNAAGLLETDLWHALALGAVIHIMGVFGDLFESVWKRAYGLKDSGNAIPGHGGYLDRFDSSLTALPSAVLYLLIFSLI